MPELPPGGKRADLHAGDEREKDNRKGKMKKGQMMERGNKQKEEKKERGDNDAILTGMPSTGSGM